MKAEHIKLNIKKLRTLRGVSQKELAEVLCTSKQNVSKYEKGQVIPPIYMLIDIADYFDVTLDELVNDYLTSDKLDIDLNLEAFIENYNLNIMEENLSNIKINNDIYVSNINKELALIDNYDDVPNVEYVTRHNNYQLSDFTHALFSNYDRDFRNSEIFHTDGLLTVSEYLKIISSLGANYDYFMKPGSLKLNITDTFLALVKLTTLCEERDGKLLVKLDYNDLLLSQYRNYYDVTFSKEGYYKSELKIKEIIKEKYNEEFDVSFIDAPMDEAHFLQYIIEFSDSLPNSVEDLYDEFNDKSNSVYHEIGKPFNKKFVETVIRKLLPDVFEFEVDYNSNRNRISMNGILNTISSSVNNEDPSSFVNFLLTNMYDDIEINKIWRDVFDSYSKGLGLTYDEADFYKHDYMETSEIYRYKKDDFYYKYNEYIKSRWVYKKTRLLDLDTLRVIKSIIYKEIIK